MGIAFVKCERVNNSISPECQFYGVPNALKTISNLEVVSPKERIINCILKFYLCLFGLGSLFVPSHRNNGLGPQNWAVLVLTPAKKAKGMISRPLMEKNQSTGRRTYHSLPFIAIFVGREAITILQKMVLSTSKRDDFQNPIEQLMDH